MADTCKMFVDVAHGAIPFKLCEFRHHVLHMQSPAGIYVILPEGLMPGEHTVEVGWRKCIYHSFTWFTESKSGYPEAGRCAVERQDYSSIEGLTWRGIAKALTAQLGKMVARAKAVNPERDCMGADCNIERTGDQDDGWNDETAKPDSAGVPGNWATTRPYNAVVDKDSWSDTDKTAGGPKLSTDSPTRNDLGAGADEQQHAPIDDFSVDVASMAVQVEELYREDKAMGRRALS
eukprot:365596-Chlamydomonas_euryale.AAC.25